MLKVFKELRYINIGMLMSVYAESNRRNAAEYYSAESPQVGILNAEGDFLNYLKEVFFTVQGAFCAAWEVKGEYVSALRMEPYKDGYLLEALETAPDHRNKGYARMLLHAVLRGSEALGGAPVYSHVDKRNAASLKVHAACGFRHISDSATFIDGSVSASSYTLLYTAS